MLIVANRIRYAWKRSMSIEHRACERGKCPTTYRTVGLVAQDLSWYIQYLCQLPVLAFGWSPSVVFQRLDSWNANAKRISQFSLFHVLLGALGFDMITKRFRSCGERLAWPTLHRNVMP